MELLAIEGERSGYELMKLVGKAIGHDWFHRHLLVHAIERAENELAGSAAAASSASTLPPQWRRWRRGSPGFAG